MGLLLLAGGRRGLSGVRGRQRWRAEHRDVKPEVSAELLKLLVAHLMFGCARWEDQASPTTADRDHVPHLDPGHQAALTLLMRYQGP